MVYNCLVLFLCLEVNIFLIYNQYIARLAQLVEQDVYTIKAVGSSPTPRTILKVL